MKTDLKWTRTLLKAIVLIAATFDASAYAANVNPQDRDLANKLTQGSMAEVQLGRAVKEKATDPAVKEFADRMVQDHSAMESQIRHWASLNGVNLAKTPSKEGTDLKGKLASTSGKNYDREYITGMLNDHKKDIAELQDFLAAHPDSALKPLVVQTIPILENHIRVAENVAGKLGIPPEKGLNKPVHPNT